MLQPVGVLAVAAVLGPARGLHVGRVPRLGAQRAQGGGRVEGAGAHLHVVGLQDDAALLAPELLQRQDQVLERLARPQPRRRPVVDLPAGFAAFFCMGWLRVSGGCGAHYTQTARRVTRIVWARMPWRGLKPARRTRYKPRTIDKSHAAEHRMAVERTLSIIKPDATARNQTGAVNALIEKAGLRIVAQKRVRWSQAQAEKFYEVHKARPFYGDLVRFMTSGPIVVQVLEGENAVKTYRDVMGATDPAKAAAGTIRKELAESIERNSVHGSDSVENAAIEIALNFKPEEIVG